MLNEDFETFFDADELAEEAIVRPSDGGNDFTILGILKKPSQQQESGIVELESNDPTFLTYEEEANKLQENDILVIRNDDYRVFRPEPDGTGLVRIVLSHAQFEY